MQRGVQHNDGEAEHIAGVGVGEDIGIELAEVLGEALHHAIDLLRFAGETEGPQELSARIYCKLIKLKFILQIIFGMDFKA